MKKAAVLFAVGVLVAAFVGLGIAWVVHGTDDGPSANPQTPTMPPDEAIAACKSKSIGEACQFEGKDGTMSGVCDNKPGVMACAPKRTQGGEQGPVGTQGSPAPQPTGQGAHGTPSPGQQNPGMPPDEAIAACKNKSVGEACQFEGKDGTMSGVCDNKPGVMACAPNRNPGAGQTPSGSQMPPTPPPTNSTQQGNSSKYSIEQAISDNAQLNTLAFDGLGFLTGNLCSDSFLPPGKVSDFFGFQYLRDTTQAGQGHSTDFVTNSANNVLSILDDGQKAKMLALAKTQASLVNEYAYKRYPLMVVFRRQLEGDIPSGKTRLSKTAVMAYSSNLYELDAEISIQRAALFADIIQSLTPSQKQYLDTMVAGGFASWPVLGDQVDKKSLSHDEHVLVMTYASEMFGWYAGDVEADTYFCPERQADYFGGFYIKDAPAIGNAGYTIDESVTGNKGQEFLGALDDTQRPIITQLVDTQREAITTIVEKRRAIATELRRALQGGTIDESRVRELAREYGALDGEISYYYATAFAQVGKTLTSEQKARLERIRDLDQYPCQAGMVYLYSQKIDMPVIPNTDFLFE